MDFRNDEHEDSDEGIVNEDSGSLAEGDYILVKFSTKNHVFHYVGKLMLLGDEPGTWRIDYLRRSYEDNNEKLFFIYPKILDNCITVMDSIVFKLCVPCSSKDKITSPFYLFLDKVVR